MQNMSYIGGFLATIYKSGDSFITIFQDLSGGIKAVMVDDGFEIKEYEFKSESSEMPEPIRVGSLQK
jgi:hypothetical protein